LQLSREDLEEILENGQLLEQLRGAVDEVLRIALTKGISKGEIEQVLLVGGSCLIPAVQQLISSYFGRSRVKLDKPFDAVAHGALAVTQLVKVEDYLRHSYAIRLWEPYSKTYSYFTLFEPGLKYPCQRPEPLVLQVAIEGQREIRLDIGEVAQMTQAEVTYDAQGRMTSSQLRQQEEYRSLESHHQQVCVAHLDPPGEVGVDRISVQFEVDTQRMLLATVKDLLTGRVLVDRGAIALLE
jgi:molecular chaperone DnaK (HSP70)